MKTNKANKAKGFTIIELMIAIAILSVILILCTVVLIGISNYYTKGINIASVQNDNRNIVNQLTSDIQFSSSPMNPGTQMVSDRSVSGGQVTIHAICFGNVRYSYVLGIVDGITHPLWRDQMTGSGSCDPLNLTEITPSCTGIPTGCLGSVANSGSSLLPSNMHLVNFSIGSPSNNDIYNIIVAIALGSSASYFEPSNPYNPLNPLEIENNNYVCKSSIGQQFCATSTLRTMATRRLNTTFSFISTPSVLGSGG